MKERLKRLERVYSRRPFYFVTTNAFRRHELLGNKNVHDAFVAFCHGALARRIFVGRYILMPDHLHLFVRFDDEPVDAGEGGGESINSRGSKAALSAWMKSLKNSLSKTLRGNGVASPHWQKGFFDHIMRNGESYSEKWRYMVENPVRAGLVGVSAEWPYQGEIYPLEF